MQMNLTTDYAVRTLVYLAAHRGIVPISEIADAMNISRKYLNRIAPALRDAGLVTAHKGQYGGYSLRRRTEDIQLYDVVRLMEGTVCINRCLEEDGYCSLGAVDHCPAHTCYAVMQRKWENFLKGITIADLLEKISEDEIERRIMGGGGRAPEQIPEREALVC